MNQQEILKWLYGLSPDQRRSLENLPPEGKVEMEQRLGVRNGALDTMLTMFNPAAAVANNLARREGGGITPATTEAAAAYLAAGEVPEAEKTSGQSARETLLGWTQPNRAEDGWFTGALRGAGDFFLDSPAGVVQQLWDEAEDIIGPGEAGWDGVEHDFQGGEFAFDALASLPWFKALKGAKMAKAAPPVSAPGGGVNPVNWFRGGGQAVPKHIRQGQQGPFGPAQLTGRDRLHGAVEGYRRGIGLGSNQSKTARILGASQPAYYMYSGAAGAGSPDLDNPAGQAGTGIDPNDPLAQELAKIMAGDGTGNENVKVVGPGSTDLDNPIANQRMNEWMTARKGLGNMYASGGRYYGLLPTDDLSGIHPAMAHPIRTSKGARPRRGARPEVLDTGFQESLDINAYRDHLRKMHGRKGRLEAYRPAMEEYIARGNPLNLDIDDPSDQMRYAKTIFGKEQVNQSPEVPSTPAPTSEEDDGDGFGWTEFLTGTGIGLGSALLARKFPWLRMGRRGGAQGGAQPLGLPNRLPPGGGAGRPRPGGSPNIDSPDFHVVPPRAPMPPNRGLPNRPPTIDVTPATPRLGNTPQLPQLPHGGPPRLPHNPTPGLPHNPTPQLPYTPPPPGGPFTDDMWRMLDDLG